MQDHLLAVAPLDDSSRAHQRVALAPAVARMVQIDVQRVQAVRTVVPVTAAAGGRADELPALSAAERLVGFCARRASRRLLPGRGASLRLSMPALATIGVSEVVGGQVVKVVDRDMAVRSQWCILSRPWNRARAVKRWSGWDARDANAVAVARTMAGRCVTVHLRSVALARIGERRGNGHDEVRVRWCASLSAGSRAGSRA